MSDSWIFEGKDESDTERLGFALASVLPNSAIIGLIGPLGAGKTRLVQSIAKAFGVQDGIVASPTFVLLHEYEGELPIFHFDAYRLRDAEEFLNIGAEEYFARPGWSIIEWADRVATCLPGQRLEIAIEPQGEATRRFSITASGALYQEALTKLRRHLLAQQ